MPTPRGAERLLQIGAAGLLALFVLRAGFLLVSPYPTEYGEGTTWTYAHLLSLHGTYFLPIADEPWIHGTYPPLFPRMHELLGGTLAAGRALGLLATLLAAATIAHLLRANGVDGRRALLWSAVFLGAPAVHEWAALCRVDTLALSLSLVGIALASRDRGEWLAAPVLAAAFFAKQVALAAPAAVILSLLWRGERRRAAGFAGFYGGLILISFFALDWRSGGEMHSHLITYTAFPGLAPGELIGWAARFAFAFPVLLPLGLARLGPILRTPVGVWVLTALGTMILAAKPGAAANYLLEPSAACVLAGALAAERRLTSLAGSPDRRRDFTLLLVVQLVVMCGPGRLLEVRDLWREAGPPAVAVRALGDGVGPVLSEDLGLTLAAGQEPMLEPFQFWLLAEAGLFDPAPVVRDVEAGRFTTVVAGWRLRNVPGVSDALDRRYRLVERAGPYEILKPIR